MTTHQREVSGFDRIRFRGPGVLRIVQDGTESLAIHGPGHMLDDIESRVSDGELHLGYRTTDIISLAAHREALSFTLHVRELRRLDCHGVVARVLVPDLDADVFEVRLSGQGHIILEHLTADRFEARIGGAGVIQARGDTEHQRIRIDGAGHYRASALVSDFAWIGISGAGKADVSVADQLDVSISGAGQVTYEGYPDITRTISGLGSLQRRRRRDKARMNGEDHGG